MDFRFMEPDGLKEPNAAEIYPRGVHSAAAAEGSFAEQNQCFPLV